MLLIQIRLVVVVLIVDGRERVHLVPPHVPVDAGLEADRLGRSAAPRVVDCGASICETGTEQAGTMCRRCVSEGLDEG